MKEKSLVLERKIRFPDRTLGVLKMNGLYFCNTLEPTYRNYAKGERKVKGKSCIPAGTYSIELKKSYKFRDYRAYLLDVPMFNGVLIHEGNSPKDTAGCILLGRLLSEKGINLYFSKTTVRNFVASIRFFEFETITIKDMFSDEFGEESIEIDELLSYE